MARGRKKKSIKRANNSGSIYRLSGTRRKPWAVRIATGKKYNPETKRWYVERAYLGYYETEEEAKNALFSYNLNPYDLNTARTFKEVYDEWAERYYSTLSNKSSERSYVSAFNHSSMLHDVNIKEITITMLKDCIDQADCGSATQGRMKSLYNLVFDYAVESEYVEVNKARQFASKGVYEQIKKDKKDKIPFSMEHIKKCHEGANYGDMKMVLIGLYTGMRPDEICEIKKDNVNLKENYIIGGMKTEAGTDRYIPIHPMIKPYIEEYYMRSTGEYLIEAYDGQNDNVMTYDKYRVRFKKCMKYIGADGLYSPHCTRHTFITQAKNCKLDEVAIKMIVGHAITDITEAVYTHRDKKWLNEELKKFYYFVPEKDIKGFKVIG